WLDAEIGRHHPAQRRTICPGAMQVFEKEDIDLVQHLIARPVKLDYEVGDEGPPVEGVKALAAEISPTASTFLPPACSITTGNAATSSAMVMGRSKNSSWVSRGWARRKPCHSTSASGARRSPDKVSEPMPDSFGT